MAVTGAEGVEVDHTQFDIAVHDGQVTVRNPATDQHRVFRIRTPKQGAFAGKRLAEVRNGDDWETFAFVNHNEGCPPRVVVWRRFRGAPNEKSIHDKYAQMLENPKRYAARGVEYHIALRCRRCDKLLTDPESIKDGLGKTCRTKPDEPFTPNPRYYRRGR